MIKNKKASERKKVNVYMSADLYEWYKNRAEEIGIPVSSLMTIAMNDYKTEREAIERMPQLTGLLSRAMDDKGDQL